jgi:hypothetical protein
VPRSKLVDELKKHSEFFSTQSLKGKSLWHDEEIEF